MEDELCYSTIIFTDSEDSKAKMLKGEEAVYVEIKTHKPFSSELSTSLLEKNAENPVFSERKMKEEVLSMIYSATTEAETTKSSPSCRPAMVCLGFLFSLLLVALTVMCVFYSILIVQYNTMMDQFKNETATRQELQTDVTNWKRETEQLKNQRMLLNQTLKFITRFEKFPVDNYCEESDCKPCQKGWIRYQSSCYFFKQERNGRSSWEDSRRFCIENGGDLAIIDSIEEQKFINQHTKLYNYYKAFWIGLADTGKNNTWLWVNGAKLGEGYWGASRDYDSQTCVLSVPNQNPSQSWRADYCSSYNRWICEGKVMIWPDQLHRGNNPTESPS